jgi:hypothetical protein
MNYSALLTLVALVASQEDAIADQHLKSGFNSQLSERTKEALTPGPTDSVFVIPTADDDGAKRLATFYQAMSLSASVGITFGDRTTVVYMDQYAYLAAGKIQYCRRNCGTTIAKFGALGGRFESAKNRITIFRSGVEPQWISGETVVANSIEVWSKRLTHSGLESAIRTLGHEAAHAKGVDLDIPGDQFHRNAVQAGQAALKKLRQIKTE